jgi:hypothetical protein
MTSSARHLKSGQARWNYDHQAYKTYDTHCEPGLISILVLSCGRPDNTKRSIDSTLQAASLYEGELEWIFLEQGKCTETYEYFMGLDLERKVVIRQVNYGINNGLNQLWSLSRGEFCMIHENDWLNSVPNFNFLATAKQILVEKNDIGIIQLRAVWDPKENWGLGKPQYSPWSCGDKALDNAKIRKWHETTKTGFKYWISDFPNGYNHNPNVMRKKLFREVGPLPEAPIGCDPRHGETQMQERIAHTGAVTAHIGEEIYYHIGQSPTKGN